MMIMRARKAEEYTGAGELLLDANRLTGEKLGRDMRVHARYVHCR